MATKDNDASSVHDARLRYLHDWHDKALDEYNKTRTALIECQIAFSDAEQRVQSIESLLTLEGAGISGISAVSVRKEDVVDATIEILKKKGQPMKIGELREQLLANNVPLPGKGNDANLIAVFQRSGGRIIRVSRGMYDIARQSARVRLELTGERIIPVEGEVSLGRADTNSIILSDASVAPSHAKIVADKDGTAELFVLNTEATTTLNGEPVKEATALSDGDVCSFGQTHLTVHLT